MGKLKKNLIYNMSYQVLILIVPFITTPYVSRVLGPEGIGEYSVTSAIAKYFWMFALLGMSNYGNRTIAKARDDRGRLSLTFWNLFYFQAIISSISLILYLAYVVIWGSSAYGVVIICQIPYVISAIFEISWFFYGMENFKFMVLRNAVIKVVTMISIFLFVQSPSDVWIYVLINTLSLLLGQLCMWPLLHKYVDFARLDWTIVKSHLRPNLILFVSVVAVSIYTLMDKIMIEIFSTTVEIGFYENTEKIMNICDSLVGAIGAVMLPRVSYMMERKDHDSTLIYLGKSMKYIMIFAIAIAFGVAGIAKEFSIIFFGKEFEICGLLLACISPAIVFYSWENILRTQYLLPGNRDNIFVMGTVLAAITNLTLNWAFISKLGALGAVIGTVGAQGIAACYQSFKVRKEIPIVKYVKDIMGAIIIGSIMYIYCRIIGSFFGVSVFTLIMQIVGGAIVFIVGIGMIMYLQKDELMYKLLKHFG